MKRGYKKPIISVSVFASENIVTNSSTDLLGSSAYKATVKSITDGDSKFINDTSEIFTFTF